jgi:hypothetical protein
MNKSFYKILAILLVFSAFAGQVQGRDVTVTLLPTDIISYDASYLDAFSNGAKKGLTQLPTATYTTD